MTGQHRVVLDASSFIKAWLIATTLWVGVMLIVALLAYGVPTVLSGEDAVHLWGAGLALAFYGYGIALVFAAPLAWVLAYLLRPVRQQWIHITAFFAVPTLAFWAVAGLLGFGWHPGWLGLWATVGAAAAVGRWSIRKDAHSSEAEVLYP
ncbi:hypothetical protein AU252_20320 [Pseudarthrobacter sulfonivorans]|uniref:Uncharacterized protein n=1 Tax=Pseudarthrobacter sulfonivorans TaxID=121292 RepID=A0A0U3P208_9MICC|nr:hypothetical protein [Pseudarthrobacter sulfonivorans]ALV43215.1 hypothetical protein AU252_20320 [Pseudarthrobacter sulfonivorans]